MSIFKYLTIQITIMVFLFVPATGIASPFENLEMPDWIHDWHLVVPSQDKIFGCPVQTYTYVNKLESNTENNKKYATVWILYEKAEDSFYLRLKLHNQWKPDFFNISRKDFKRKVQLPKIPAEVKSMLLDL
ncbi:MAG: hypothetical protein ACQES5_10790 [Thermodesulfobacteriota bacterium]